MIITRGDVSGRELHDGK